MQSGDKLCVVIDELNSKNIGALIVKNPDGKIAGIVSERDILKKACSMKMDTDKEIVSEIMTPKDKLIVGTPDDTVAYAMNVMTSKKIRHLPIFRDDKITGIISIRDIVEFLLEQSEEENKLLKEHIRNPYGINAL